jgi:hypothetical protein
MSQTRLESLEERVAALEKRLAELLSPTTIAPARFKDWRRAIGTFAGDDEVMQEIDAAGREYREADRRDTSL